MTTTIRPLVAGNWKMHGVAESLLELRLIGRGFVGELELSADCVVCVPATLVTRAVAAVEHSPIRIGGQDCHRLEHGAHTGDISAEMLKDAGASHVIVGHSERRIDHHETDADVHAKAEAAWRAGLCAIVCIGETREQRERGETNAVLTRQIEGSIAAAASPTNTIVAYEPVWAIGTGLTPSVADVAEAHAHIRAQLGARIGPDAARMRILYGGSVKPSNAGELLAIANVNGALVGGASLKAKDLLAIADVYRSF